MTTVFFDVRDAVRGLCRDRAYAVAVLLTLALTIGGSTAVFSIVDGVLLKPLGYPDAHRLVTIQEGWNELRLLTSGIEVNEQHFEYWRQRATTFESMAQYIVLPANLTGVGDATQIPVGRVSGSLFDVLRVQAARGRALNPSDEPSGRPEVAVISDACWRQRFAADPAIVGRSIVLDGKPRTIVGVLGPEFRLPTERLVSSGEAFVPIHMDTERVGWVGDHNNEAFGRLRDGVSLQQARAELDLLQRRVSEIATNEAKEPVSLTSVVRPLSETVVGRSRRGLLLLLGAIAAVLLIACANLANLSLTRAIGRLRDAAIRSAIGASRSRLAVRSMVEQVVLSLSGGAFGLAVAWAALRVFVRTAPIDLPRVNEVAIDARVLAFAAAVSTIAGIAVSALPAWRQSRVDVERQLRAGALTTTSDRGGIRARAALLTLQIGLSVALLVVTGLLAGSLVRVMNVDRGFAAEPVLLVPVSLPANRYPTEASLIVAYDRLLPAVRALPGVTSASVISAPPLSGSGQVNSVVPAGSALPRSRHPSANYRFVGPEFFQTIGIAVLRGRAFTDAERPPAHMMPALISDRTAQRLWPDQDALGKQFSRGIPGEAGFEVVGIVADAKLTSLERTPPLMVYLPYWWRSRMTTQLIVKTAGDPAAIMPAVRRAVSGVDDEIAIGNARPLDELVGTSMAGRRYQVQLFVAFAAVALFIAVLGVYAVTAYGVSQRRRELNIRAALGASPAHVLGMVARQSGRPIVAGLAAGMIGALALSGVVASLLFEVQARDPRILAAVTLIVGAIAALATFVAARQGLTYDPAAALRED
jgi:putative ABC transport system permease protein